MFGYETDGRNILCECGHPDRRHADRDDGTKWGAWGVGECELCGCKVFVPKLRPIKESEKRMDWQVIASGEVKGKYQGYVGDKSIYNIENKIISYQGKNVEIAIREIKQNS